MRRAGRAWYISKGRCEGSPDPSEVPSLGKLSVFSKSPIGTLGKSFITVLGRLLTFKLAKNTSPALRKNDRVLRIEEVDEKEKNPLVNCRV